MLQFLSFKVSKYSAREVFPLLSLSGHLHTWKSLHAYSSNRQHFSSLNLVEPINCFKYLVDEASAQLCYPAYMTTHDNHIKIEQEKAINLFRMMRQQIFQHIHTNVNQYSNIPVMCCPVRQWYESLVGERKLITISKDGMRYPVMSLSSSKLWNKDMWWIWISDWDLNWRHHMIKHSNILPHDTKSIMG